LRTLRLLDFAFSDGCGDQSLNRKVRKAIRKERKVV